MRIVGNIYRNKETTRRKQKFSSESKRLDGPAWLSFAKEKADAFGKLKWVKPLPDANLKPQDFEMAENPWKDDMGAKRGSVAVPSDE